MNLTPLDSFDHISPQDFRMNYYEPNKPVIIRNLSRPWAAYSDWNWDFIKQKVGDTEVGVYNNIKSDPYTPVNKSDGIMKFGDYVDLIRQGPAGLRIFLFNILDHCPEMLTGFTYPEDLMTGFLKRWPMLFTGGAGSITHMHFDMDLTHIMHTQFMGKKRVLLFDFEEGSKLYHLPFTVQSLVNFEKYYEGLDVASYPALGKLKGYEYVMEHGDTLFMPSGYWHHMEYLESGLALSLRAFNEHIPIKLRGIFNVLGVRNFDTLMKKTIPDVWFNYKKGRAMKNARNVMNAA